MKNPLLNNYFLNKTPDDRKGRTRDTPFMGLMIYAGMKPQGYNHSNT